MSRYLIALLILITSNITHAQWEGNFLLGLDGGYAWRDAKSKLTILEPLPLNASTVTLNDHRDNGFIWGAFTGYQLRCHRFLVGLELKLSFEDVGEKRFSHASDASGDQYNIYARHERESVLGLSIRTGYSFSSGIMPYVRLGAQTSSENLLLGAKNFTSGFDFELEDRRRSTRLVAGAGLEFPLNSGIDLRMEYNYSRKGRGAKSQGVIPVSGEHVSMEIKPNQHSALGAVVFKFD